MKMNLNFFGRVWADDINYFANAGFDAGFLAINYLKAL